MKRLLLTLSLLCLTIISNAQYGQFKYSPKKTYDSHWSDYTVLYTGILTTFSVVTYVNSNISNGTYTMTDMNKAVVTSIAGTLLTYGINKQIRTYCERKHKHKRYRYY